MSNLPINQILHGDCIQIMKSLPDHCVDLIFADPPYNLQLGGDLWRPNMTQVDAVDDEWDKFGSFEEYDAFTCAWMREARRVLKNTGTLWVIGTYHNISRIGTIMMDGGWWLLNDIVWIKENPMPQMKGVRFCNAHETLLWAKRCKDQQKYTFHYRGLRGGNEDKQMRSDWRFPICTGKERLTQDGKKAHATQKPEALLHRVITSTSNPGDLILDPFCGTGTTATVAHRLGRHFITMDKVGKYVQLARERVAQEMPELITEEATFIDAPKPRISFLSLVEAGKIRVGTHLYLKGKPSIVATVQEDGTLIADGIRGSIHKLGAHFLGVPSCNGWMHWLYCDSDSEYPKLLDSLRPSALGT